MTACTPVYQLPYQEGSDPPCDFSDVSRQFAEIVDSKSAEWDGILARTATTVPFAKVAATTPQDIAESTVQRITWDTVAADNDNMVNLAADPRAIKLRRTGLWRITYHIRCSGLVDDDMLSCAGPGETFDLQTIAAPARAAQRWRTSPGSTELDGIKTVSLQSQGIFAVPQASLDSSTGVILILGVSITALQGTLIPVDYAEMTAHWFAELP